MKAVFLDRDGTVDVELGEGKINAPDKMILLPHSLQALNELSQLDYSVFFITNQLGIATGAYTEKTFYEVNKVLLDKIAPTGVKILKTYFCPHAPEDNCECRKPKPGMILQAANDYDIDLEDSWMVGDRPSDIGAGHAAGTRAILLDDKPEISDSEHADFVAIDLLEAVRYIAAH